MFLGQSQAESNRTLDGTFNWFWIRFSSEGTLDYSLPEDFFSIQKTHVHSLNYT